jgi:hypothetical protein
VIVMVCSDLAGKKSSSGNEIGCSLAAGLMDSLVGSGERV